MISLIYVSLASRPMVRKDLVALLQQSRAANEAADISGLLLYDHGSFMQILEGDEKVIDALMKKIEADLRHQNLKVLEKLEITERQFPEWSMAFLDSTWPALKSIPGYSRFLEKPLTTEDVIRSASKSEDLLLLFKTIMTVLTTSWSSLLRDELDYL